MDPFICSRQEQEQERMHASVTIACGLGQGHSTSRNRNEQSRISNVAHARSSISQEQQIHAAVQTSPSAASAGTGECWAAGATTAQRCPR